MRLAPFVALATCLAIESLCGEAFCQGLGAYDPSRGLMNQVTAQSEIVHTNIDFMRATGQLAQQMAQARLLHAQARSGEAAARVAEKSADVFDAESYWYLR